MFILDPNFSIPDPGSKRFQIPDPHKIIKFIFNLTQKIVSMLSEIGSVMFSPDPDLDI